MSFCENHAYTRNYGESGWSGNSRTKYKKPLRSIIRRGNRNLRNSKVHFLFCLGLADETKLQGSDRCPKDQLLERGLFRLFAIPPEEKGRIIIFLLLRSPSSISSLFVSVIVTRYIPSSCARYILLSAFSFLFFSVIHAKYPCGPPRALRLTRLQASKQVQTTTFIALHQR